MREREPNKEIIQRGELLFLLHPGTDDVFSGYGLTVKEGSKEHLVGLLMIDRPPDHVDEWLQQVEERFGGYELSVMTKTGERGILCQMQIEPLSQPFLNRLPFKKADAIRTSLEPLLEEPPKPSFLMRWKEEKRAWASQMASPNELPPHLRELFEKRGYGCLAVEANVGVVHVCHAPDADIKGFTDKPITSQWQLIKMPTAPLIRLELTVMDRPEDPYHFESFLNVAAADQAKVLADLANQDRLYLAFYGDDLGYRYIRPIPHDEQHWQHLDEIVHKAQTYLNSLPPLQRDFDQAKAEFMRRNV